MRNTRRQVAIVILTGLALCGVSACDKTVSGKPRQTPYTDEWQGVKSTVPSVEPPQPN